jgi:hypothetical protein
MLYCYPLCLWILHLKSLNKRKLTVLETHKRRSISTNECLTSYSNSETVCDNNNCDKSSTISIQKDGNCFFRCISSFLHNTEVYHENIRHEVTNTLSNNKEFYFESFTCCHYFCFRGLCICVAICLFHVIYMLITITIY